jgi:hypothetical protein
MRRTILGLLAFALPLIGAPMGVKAEELNATVSQSAGSTVVSTPLAAPVPRLSTRADAAEIRALRIRLEAERTSGEQSSPLPVILAIQVAAPVAVAPASTTPTPGIVVPPRDSIPQQGEGKWNPFRLHTEFRSRPWDTAFDVKSEVYTRNGWMFGGQFVTQSGSFTGDNPKEIWKGQYTDARFELWAGIHRISKDTKTRWSVNGFVGQLSHEDSGEGKSRPGKEYPYAYTWKNSVNPLTQLGVRARIERDLIQNKYQQFTVFIEGETAATVAGESGLAFNSKTGLWSRTQQTEVSAEVGVNNIGLYANGYGRYYLTKGGQLRPFAEVRGEVGTGYHNVQVGGGLQVGIGKNGYGEFSGGHNWGSAGDGPTFKIGGGLRF